MTPCEVKALEKKIRSLNDDINYAEAALATLNNATLNKCNNRGEIAINIGFKEDLIIKATRENHIAKNVIHNYIIELKYKRSDLIKKFEDL